MAYSNEREAAILAGVKELYEFDFGAGHIEYYTTARKAVSHDWGDGNGEVTYKPLPISRESIGREGQVAPDEVSITLPTQGTFVDTLAKGALGTVQVRIIRGFGELTAATESNFQRYWFVGVLADTRVNRIATVGQVRSIEYIFDKTLGPRDSYQPVCNNSLYEGRCGRGISIDDFTYTAELVEVTKDGTEVVLEINPGTQHGNDPEDHWQIGDGDLGDVDGVGFFTLGQVWDSRSPGGRRMCIEHSYDALDGTGRNGNPIARFRLLAPLGSQLEDKVMWDGMGGGELEATANLIEDSEDFSTSSWTQAGTGTVESAVTQGPFFGSRADRLTAGASGTLRQTLPTLSDNDPYSFSIYVKRDDSAEGIFSLIAGGGAGGVLTFRVDPATMHTWITSQSVNFLTAGVALEEPQEVGNGWWRIGVRFTYDVAMSTIELALGADASFSSLGTFMWGASFIQASSWADYEHNQPVTIKAAWGCSKTGTACSTKFNNLNQAVYFKKIPGINPVTVGFTRP